MSTEARIAQAARDLASELDSIGTLHADFVSKTFNYFADLVDGREPSPDGPGNNRRQRAHGMVNAIITHYGWIIPSHLVPETVIDEIIDAVDLA